MADEFTGVDLSSFSGFQGVDLGNLDSYSGVDLKKLDLNGKTAAKKAELVAASAFKKRNFEPNRLPDSVEEFLAINPQGDPEEYKLAKREELLTAEIRKNGIAQLDVTTTPSDTVKDTALSLAKGVVNIGGTAYGIADIISRGVTLDQGSLDRLTGGFSENFSRSREILDSFQSEALQLERAESQLKGEKFQVREEQRKAKDIQGGDSPLLAAIKEQGRQFKETLVGLADNPYEVADLVLSSAPELLASGAVGKLAKGVKLRGKTVEEAAEFMASAAGQKAISKAATRANLSYIAASEGMSNGLDAKAEILGASEELLLASPDYQELLKSGMSPEDARMELADDAFDIVASLSATIGVGAASIPGLNAAKITGNMFNGVPLKNVVRDTIGRVASGAASEGVEETIQGAGGTFASNVGKTAVLEGKKATDVAASPESLKDTGSSAAQGLVAGGLSGGAIASPAAALSGLAASAAGVKEGIQKTKDKIQAQKDKKVELNPEAEGYVPKDAYQAETRKAPAKDSEEYGDYVNRLATHTDKMAEDAQAAVDAVDKATAEGADELTINKLSKVANDKLKISEEFDARLDKVIEDQEGGGLTQSVTDTLDNEEATPEQAEQAAGQVFRSAPIDDPENDAFRKVAANQKVSQETRDIAEKFVEIQDAITKPQEKLGNKTLAEVNSDILDGGDGFRGIAEYQTLIAQASKRGRVEKTTGLLTSLSKFSQHHTAKLNLLTDIKTAIGGRSNAQIANDPAVTRLVTQMDQQFPRNDGKKWDLHKGSFKTLLPTVETEVSVINNMLAATGLAAKQHIPEISNLVKKELRGETDGQVQQEQTPQPKTTQKTSEATSPPVEAEVTSGISTKQQGSVVQTRTDKKGRVTTVTETVTEKDGVKTTKFVAEREGKKTSLPHVKRTAAEFVQEYALTQDSQEQLQEISNVQEIRVKEVRESTNGSKAIDVDVVTPEGTIAQTYIIETSNLSTEQVTPPVTEAPSEAKPEAEVAEEVDATEQAIKLELGKLKKTGKLTLEKTIEFIGAHTVQQVIESVEIFATLSDLEKTVAQDLNKIIDNKTWGTKISVKALDTDQAWTYDEKNGLVINKNSPDIRNTDDLGKAVIQGTMVMALDLQLKVDEDLLTDSQKTGIAQLKNAQAALKSALAAVQNPSALLVKASEDLATFASEGLINPEVRKILGRLKSVQNKNVSLKNRFISAVRRILNMRNDDDSALNELLEGYSRLTGVKRRQFNKQLKGFAFANEITRHVNFKAKGFMATADSVKEAAEANPDIFAGKENFVDHLNGHVENFTGHLANVPPVTYFKGGWKTDPSKLLMTLKGVFPKAIQNAMAITGYEWLATRGKETVVNDKSQIRRLLGLDSKEEPSTDAINELRYAGSVAAVVAEELGNRFLNHFGINTKRTAGAGFKKTLAMAVGYRILQAMQSQNMVEFNEVDPAIFGNEDTSEFVSYMYVRVTTATDEKGRVRANPFSQQASSFFKDSSTRDAFSSLTAAEGVAYFPPSTIPKPIGDKIKNTTQRLSKKRRTIVDKQNARPVKIKQNVSRVWEFLDKETKYLIAGVKPAVGHKHAVASQNAANDGLIREVDYYDDFLDDIAGRASGTFYLPYSVKKNMRMHIDTLINPQASKVHRHLVGLEDHTATINKNDKVMMDYFMLSVLEGMGVGINKQNMEANRQAFADLIAREDIQQAIGAISYIQGTNPDFIGEVRSERDQEQATQFVNEALTNLPEINKNHLWALDSLTALYEMQNSTGPTFTTDLTREVDGITNGMMLSVLQYGGGHNYNDLVNKLRKGGVYIADDVYADYNEFRTTDGNLDAYESIGVATAFHMDALPQDFLDRADEAEKDPTKQGYAKFLRIRSKQVEKVARLLGHTKDGDLTDPDQAFEPLIQTRGEKAGSISKFVRELMKDSLMTTGYGAGRKKVSKNVALKILQNTYDQLVKLDGIPGTEATRKQIIDDLNDLVWQKDATKIPYTQKGWVNFELTPSQEENFINAFDETFGEALFRSIGTVKMHGEYSSMIQQRQVLTAIMELSFNVFYPRLQANISAAEAAKGSELSENEIIEEIDALNDIAPILPTLFGDSLKEGLLFSSLKQDKSGKANNILNDTGSASIRMELPISVKGESVPRKNITAKTGETTLTEPGVKAGVGTIHHLDASIMALVMDKFGVVNIHDAAIFGVHQTEEVSKALNDAFLQLSEEYNILEEGQALYARLVAELDKAENADEKRALEDTLANLNISVPRAVQIANFQRDKYFGNELLSSQYDQVVPNSETSKNVIDNLREAVAQSLAEQEATVTNEAGYSDNLQKFTGRYKKNMVEDIPAGLPASDVYHILDAANNVVLYVHYPRTGNQVTFWEVTDLATPIVKDIQGNPTEYINTIARTFGSSESALNKERFLTSREVTSDTTVSIFDELGRMHSQYRNGILGGVQESAEHSSYLKDLLSKLSDRVVRPFELRIHEDPNKDNLGEVNIDEGIIDLQASYTASRGLSYGLRMSAQEVFAHELIHPLIAAGVDSDTRSARRLKQLFDVVKKQTTPEDFMNRDTAGNLVSNVGVPITNRQSQLYKDEYAEAKKRYDYIFNNRQSLEDISSYLGKKKRHERNPYLHEFATIGLTNASFIKKLKAIDVTPDDFFEKKTEKSSVFRALRSVLDHILDFFGARVDRGEDFTAHDELQALVMELSRVHEQKTSFLFDKLDNFNTATTKKINDWVVEPIKNFSGDEELPPSDQATIKQKFARHARHLRDSDRTDWHFAFRKFLTRQNEVPDSHALNFIDELFGTPDQHKKIENQARVVKYKLDHGRVTAHNTIAEKMLDVFGERTLDKNEKVSLTRAGIMPDLTVLLAQRGENGEITNIIPHHTMDQIADLLLDGNKVDAAIAVIENRLRRNYTSEQYNWYWKMSRNLGTFMATKTTTEEVTVLDALSIADGSGNPHFRAPRSLENATAEIDTLATLYALKATDTNSKETLGKLIQEDPGAVEFVLRTHNDIKEQALKLTFNGQKKLMIKGYTSELTNPSIMYQVANEEDGEQLIARGYQKSEEPFIKDPVDPNREELFYYISPYAQQNALESGAVSYTHETAKGTTLKNTHLTLGNPNAVTAARSDFRRVLAAKEAQMRRIMSPRDTTKRKGNALIPVTDASGKIMDFRYIMSEDNKRNLLEKNESFEHVLGSMAANILDKVETKRANRQAVDQAKEEYDTQFSDDPDSYILVGPNSTDPKAQEVYRMLPDDMKRHIRRVWGANGMFVHQSAWKIMFGQRKLSFSTLALMDTEGLESFELLKANVNNMLTEILHTSTGLAIEQTWQDFVTVAKDTIVIRSIEVLVGNIISNQLSLLLLGVDPVQGTKDQLEAWFSAKKYMLDIANLKRLQQEMRIDVRFANSNDAIQKEIELKNSIATNPVRELFEAGVYQSINEEIYTLDETSLFKTGLEKRLSPVTDRIDPRVKNVISHLTLAHDTAIYEGLKDLTQLSDFMARYALHKHNMKKNTAAAVEAKGGELTDDELQRIKEDSINNIVETFINYDAPTDPWMQYANDWGLLMFTKYWLRNQRVLAQVLKNRPGSLAILMALQGITGVGLPNIFDTTLFDARHLNTPPELVMGAIQNHPLFHIYSALFG